jgi:branched-chain amino acid transport system substrate-binding protein
MLKYRSVSALTLIGALALAPAAQAANELIIGYSMAKTGPYVSLSASNEIAADMAVDEINAKGGINGRKVKLAKFDTAGNPKDAGTAVRRFAVDEKALAIVGPFSSGECRVAFPDGERMGIVQMSMASSAPGLTADMTYAFRNTVDEGKVISDVMETFARKKIPTTRAAIAYGTDDAVSKAIGTGVLPKVFEKYQSQVVSTVDFSIKAFDLSPQASQLVQAKPEVIGFGAPPEMAIKLATELQRQGLKARMIAGTTVADPDLPKRMAPAGEGFTIGTTFFRDLNPATKAFSAEFEKRAKTASLPRTEPSQMDAATYDIVHMYADALAATKATGDDANLAKERTAVRDHLAKLKNHPMLEGAISFGANRDSIKPIYIIEARAGAWALIDTHDPK